MAKIIVPQPISESIPDHLHIPKYKKCQCWFDVHCPQHNSKLINLALMRALKTKTTRLFLGGDTFNLGWASSFLNRTKYSPEDTEEEFKVAENLFNALSKVFSEIILVGGNHDQGRWSKILGDQVEFSRLVKMMIGNDALKKTKITSRRYCTMDSPSGIWRVTHQAGQGRKRQLSMAEELASVKQQNVMMGHQHYLGMVVERTGNYWAIDSGHMSDANLQEYKNKQDTLHTTWASGFVELDEYGIPTLWRQEDLKSFLRRK